MPKNVDIEIFPIAQTMVNRYAVFEWLKYIGVEDPDHFVEQDNIVSDPALLIALAAKRCYMSFEVGMNPNVTKIRRDYVKYFDNLLTSKHGSTLEHSVYSFAIEGVSRVFCYHPNTDVLTITGWKSIDTIKDDEIVLTLNPITKKPRWSKVNKMYYFDYVGELLFWKNKEDQSPKVTPNHILWCCPTNQRKVRGKKASEAMIDCAEKIRFSDLFGKPFFVQNSINEIEGTIDDICINIGEYTYKSDDLMEWLGFVATDGTIIKDETGRSLVRINQSKEIQVNNICSLCKRLFGDDLHISGKNYKCFDISRPCLREWCIKMIKRTKNERDLSPLFQFSPRLIKSFLNGVFSGDGCHGKFGNRDISCGGNDKLAGQYQILISIAGRASQVIIRTDEIGKKITINGFETTNNLPAVRVSEHQRGEGSCVVKSKHQFKEMFNGKVYCPLTDDGIIYVRNKEGGKGVWCGNTAEMNRHRAGWAISEGSLRFIRFDKDIPYWLPPSIQPDADDNADLSIRKQKTRELFEATFSFVEEMYSGLLQIWEMDEKDKNFSYKKKVTSCLRRIVPMGVATGGIWTGNIRALRHVIAMRTAPAAEEEISHVFHRIADYIIKSEPLLFQDTTIDDSGNVAMNNWKV